MQKSQERDQLIRDQDALNELSARNVENDKLTRILRSRGLSLFEVLFIAADSYHCLNNNNNYYKTTICKAP